MKIKFLGLVDEVIAGAELLKENLGFEISDNGADVTVGRCEKGFSVSIKGNSAEINYERPIDFFRALSITVDALKKGENKELSQTYAFESCGISIDVSRRAVLKVEVVKNFLRYMACMGLNRLMLYTEDTYELDEYPYFGYMRGAYTKEELKDIVAYGNTLGIETVPSIQVLAHMEAPLRWAAFKDIVTAHDTLLVGEEKTYEFIEDIIKTTRECFSSNTVNLAMDEAFNINLGTYLKKNGYRKSSDVLCEHMRRVFDILKKYDFKPIVDGNPFLAKLFHSDNPEGFAKEYAGKIPEEATLIYWSYEGRSEDTYEERFAQMNMFRHPIIYFGGIHTWTGPSINYRLTFESTLSVLRAAKRCGIKDVIATLWGDEGSECDMTSALLGLQLYAECNYTGCYMHPEEIKNMFRICTGFEADSFIALDLENYFNRPCPPNIMDKIELNIEKYPTYAISRQAFYQNPMFGLFDKNFESVDLAKHYKTLYDKFKNVTVPKGYETLFEYTGQLIKVLVSKCDIGIRLKKAYDSKDMATLETLADELQTVSEEIRNLYRVRAKLWYENNKPFGFEEVGNRLMAAVGLTSNAAARVRSYLCGEVESLPELEAERLYYNGEDMPFHGDYFPQKVMMP